MGYMERMFEWYGGFVARHPWPFVVGPLLLTVLTLLGLTRFHMEHNVWSLYLPTDYYGYTEEQAFLPFDSASGKAVYTVRILVTSTSDSSLYTETALGHVIDMDAAVVNTSMIDDDGLAMHYTHICTPVCLQMNSQALAILLGTLKSARYTLTYPIVDEWSPDAFLGYSVGQLIRHVEAGDDEPIEGDVRIGGFRLLILTYFVRSSDIRGGFTSPAANHLEAVVRGEVADFNERHGDDYTARVFSPQMMSEAMVRFSMKSLPYSATTALLLVVFMLLTLTTPNARYSQHFESVTGIIGPGLAIASGFCTMFLLGVPFTNLLTVIPFLVLVIGVDDAFLILAAWRHTSIDDPVDVRAGKALSKAGTSVTITSFTDVVCFLVGLQTSMPITQIFSAYCATALAFDYLYQMTFFLAATSLWEEQKQRWYRQSKNHAIHKMSVNNNECIKRSASTGGLVHPRFSIASRPSAVELNEHYTDTQYHELAVFRGARKLYKRLAPECKLAVVPSTASLPIQRKSSAWVAITVDATLHSAAVNTLRAYVRIVHECAWYKALVLLSYPVHLACAVYLCAHTVPQFSINRLYTDNEEIMATSTVIEQFLYNDCYTTNYVTRQPPNLADAASRARFMEMVGRLESIEHCSYGRPATRLWTLPLDIYVEWWGEEGVEAEIERLAIDGIRDEWIYADTNGTSFDIRTDTIRAFWWTHSYHNISEAHQLTTLIEGRRRIVDDYPDFDVYGSHELDKISDLFSAIPDKMMRTAGWAVVLMTLTVVAIVRDLRASFWVVQALFSICAGVIGYSSLFGVDLDGITMLAVLMIVGVAVDFTTHIAYHFFTSEESSSRERLYDTLVCAGWPTLQGIASSALGMMPIVMIGAYLVHVFWTIILIAAALGTYHTLFLFPTVFVMFHSRRRV